MRRLKKNFSNLSLKYKFLIVFLILITLPTICIGFFIYIKVNQVYNDQAFSATQTILDKVETNLSEIIQSTQSISDFAIYNEDFRTFMTSPTSEFNEEYYRRSVGNIEGYLHFQLFSNDYVNSITVRGENENFINTGEPLIGDESHIDLLAEQKKGEIYWSDTYPMESGWSENPVNVISLTRIVNDYNNINESIGTVRIRINANEISQLIGISNTILEQGGVFLTSKTGSIILEVPGKNQVNIDKEILTTIDERSTSFNYSNNDQDYLIVSRKIDEVDWNLIAVVNENEIASQLVDIRVLIRNMIISLTLLGLIGLIGYYYANVRRIIDLTNSTEKIENKDFTVKVTVNSKDEIGKLGYRFNKMVETIRNHIDIEYKLKMRHIDSELKALQSQIDPHFLYNTLDMIRWKARMEGATEASHLIELLSNIFRSTLKTNKFWLSVDDELHLVKNYLELQNKRMNGSLNYSINIDDQVKKLWIIKQTIQPLIENVIKHGFYGIRDEKIIQVHVYQVDEKLVLDVIDNGKGMERTTFEQAVNSSEGHALNNIQERINLAFGSQYGVKLVNDTHTPGTFIRMEFPRITNEPDLENLHKKMGEAHDD